MFGISWAEFLVIFLVAVLVIPSRMWPDVARFIARVINFIRGVLWRITDASEKLKTQIELEQPITEILQSTTDDILDGISVKKKQVTKSKRGARKK